MLLVVLVLFALFSTSLGQQKSCMPANKVSEELFKAADADADGVMTLKEMTDIFSVYDSNRDQAVSRDEYVTFQTSIDASIEKVAEELFKAYDVTGDGNLDSNDYGDFYKKMDNDGNSQVSKAEFVAFFTKLIDSVKHLSQHFC